MSGPKCGSLHVESNLERERRIIAELRSTLKELESELENVRAEWSESCRRYGEAFPKPMRQTTSAYRATTTITDLQANEAGLRRELSEQRASLEEAQAAFRIREMLRGLSGVKSAHESISRPPPGRELDSVGPALIQKRQELAAMIAGSLMPSVATSEREMVEKVLQETLKCSATSKFDAYLLELRRVVQGANDRAAQQEIDQAQALHLLRLLAGLNGREVQELKRELGDVMGGKLSLRSDIGEEVKRASQAASAADDQQYASRVLIEELQRLGYSTENGMETITVDAGVIQLTKPDMKEYAVELATDNVSRQFEVQLAREAGSDSVEGKERRLLDRNTEEKWCLDLANALSAAEARGVVARITKHSRPGALPVKVIRRSESGSSRKARKSLTRPLGKQ